MHELSPFYSAFFTVMFLACGIVFLAESEYRNRTFIKIIQRWLRLPPPEGILLAVFLAVCILPERDRQVSVYKRCTHKASVGPSVLQGWTFRR